MSYSVTSSVTEILLLLIRVVEEMSREYILEVRIGALYSILLSNNTRMGEAEPLFASKDWKLNASTADLNSMQWCFRFVEYTANFMQEHVQS